MEALNSDFAQPAKHIFLEINSIVISIWMMTPQVPEFYLKKSVYPTFSALGATSLQHGLQQTVKHNKVKLSLQTKGAGTGRNWAFLLPFSLQTFLFHFNL